MNLLITGGCGFLGTNLVRYLSANRPEYHLTVFDLLTYAGSKSNIKQLLSNKNVSFVEGDICDRDQLKAVLEYGIDMVVNLAAETHVDRSIASPEEFVRTNVFGTQVLLDCCRKKSVSLLHVSTDEVYGPTPDGVLFSEDAHLQPTSPYAASKASADLLIIAAHTVYEQPAMIVRPVNNLGPFQYPEKLIPLFVDRLSRGLPVPVYGDGMQKRMWLFVEDFCSAIDFVIDGFTPGECFNLASKFETTNIDLTQNLVNIIGCKNDLIRFVDDRPAHDQRYALDDSRFMNRYGWLPRYSFDRALEKTVKWYLDNQDWLKSRRTKQYDEYFNRQYGAL